MGARRAQEFCWTHLWPRGCILDVGALRRAAPSGAGVGTAYSPGSWVLPTNPGNRPFVLFQLLQVAPAQAPGTSSSLSVNWLHPPGRSDVATSFRMSRDFRSSRGAASTTRRHDPRLCRLCRAPVAGRSFHGDVEYQPTRDGPQQRKKRRGEHPSDPRVTA